MPIIVNIFSWVLGEQPQDHLICFMKGLRWVPFAAEATVMNGHAGHCDCCLSSEHHSSSPQPSPRAAWRSWLGAVSHCL